MYYVLCLLQKQHIRRCLYQTMLQRFLYWHSEEDCQECQVYLWSLSGYQRKTWKEDQQRVERHGWRGSGPFCFSINNQQYDFYFLISCRSTYNCQWHFTFDVSCVSFTAAYHHMAIIILLLMETFSTLYIKKLKGVQRCFSLNPNFLLLIAPESKPEQVYFKRKLENHSQSAELR